MGAVIEAAVIALITAAFVLSWRWYLPRRARRRKEEAEDIAYWQTIHRQETHRWPSNEKSTDGEQKPKRTWRKLTGYFRRCFSQPRNSSD